MLQCGYSIIGGSEMALVSGSVALLARRPSPAKLDIRIFVERLKGSSSMAGGMGLVGTFAAPGRGRMVTSSRSSPECTPLDVSDGARSGGDADSSVDVVSDRGVSASLGTPESARLRHRGVKLDVIYKL